MNMMLEELVRPSAAALSADDPPILPMGPNRPGATYRRDFQNHWVMIPELRVTADHAELTVSSWGQSFVIDLDGIIRSKLFISLVALRVRERDHPLTKT